MLPHHFNDIQQAMRDMARLARRGGLVAIIDLQGYPDPVIDEFNHRIELWHDPTHVRSYTAARWQELFHQAGLQIEALEPDQTERVGGISIRRWCAIGNSGATAESNIRQAMAAAEPRVLGELGIVRDADDFRIPIRTVLIVGRKPA